MGTAFGPDKCRYFTYISAFAVLDEMRFWHSSRERSMKRGSGEREGEEDEKQEQEEEQEEAERVQLRWRAQS
eukprot:365693-Pyramimonas_sp.AAC.1